MLQWIVMQLYQAWCISMPLHKQEWLSPQGKFALTYQTEEILITEAVTVEPKPITKDPEENQDYHNPSVTQMLFTQTSYVGLPGTHEASQPITMVCPAGTSYTQLPCSVWGLSIGEVQVVSSASQDEDVWDASESSHADSGCSCHDLTQSPECSLPNSPVGDSLPPCYCSDYCILNKTAGGVVPVLVSKWRSPNVSSDFQGSEEPRSCQQFWRKKKFTRLVPLITVAVGEGQNQTWYA